MTMTEQIFSRKLNTKLEAGDRVEVTPDQILANEMLGAIVIPKMKTLGARIINPKLPKEVIKCFLDHGGIGASAEYVQLHQTIKQFCTEQGLTCFEGGTGIGHVVMPEIGATSPGDIIVGTDSHTTTQGALNTFAQGIGASDLLELLIRSQTWFEIPPSIKFTLTGKFNDWVSAKDAILQILHTYGLSFALGAALEYECPPTVSIAERQTISNMSAELGVITAIFPYDSTLKEFLKGLTLERAPRPTFIGNKTEYLREESLNLDEVIPYVAKPHRPNNVVPASELSDIVPDQIYIGSCTNARIEDLRVVARILKNRTTRILTLISPGSSLIQRQAENEGLLKIFLEAGCRLIYPGCNACFGGPIGLLGKDMIGLSTTNRNFEGRMGGDSTTKVYLASPATAAATAVNGYITDPRDIK